MILAVTSDCIQRVGYVDPRYIPDIPEVSHIPEKKNTIPKGEDRLPTAVFQGRAIKLPGRNLPHWAGECNKQTKNLGSRLRWLPWHLCSNHGSWGQMFTRNKTCFQPPKRWISWTPGELCVFLLGVIWRKWLGEVRNDELEKTQTLEDSTPVLPELFV